jgi:hypothetical protein
MSVHMAPTVNQAATLIAEQVSGCLQRDGYYVARVHVSAHDAVPFVLDVGRSFGELFVPADCDAREPVIRTTPTRSTLAAPFDRAEPIGWHGDFATHEDRPHLSLSYITRGDPRGGLYGGWRLCSVARVVDELRESRSGRAALQFLSEERLPFSYAAGEVARWFRVVEAQSDGREGLRFYLPSIRRGCVEEWGEVPSRIAIALLAVEKAADAVADVVPTRTGSLLIASNWFALHDRIKQTISRVRPSREALLCFVARATIIRAQG